MGESTARIKRTIKKASVVFVLFTFLIQQFTPSASASFLDSFLNSGQTENAEQPTTPVPTDSSTAVTTSTSTGVDTSGSIDANEAFGNTLYAPTSKIFTGTDSGTATSLATNTGIEANTATNTGASGETGAQGAAGTTGVGSNPTGTGTGTGTNTGKSPVETRDGSGHVISRETFFEDGSRATFERFDDNGQRTYYEDYAFSGRIARIETTENVNGQQILTRTYYGNNAGRVVVQLTEVETYDIRNNPISTPPVSYVIRKKVSNIGIRKTVWEYDTSGRLMQINEYENNVLTRLEEYEIFNGSAVKKQVTKFYSDGRTPKEIHFYSKGQHTHTKLFFDDGSSETYWQPWNNPLGSFGDSGEQGPAGSTGSNTGTGTSTSTFSDTSTSTFSNVSTSIDASSAVGTTTTGTDSIGVETNIANQEETYIAENSHRMIGPNKVKFKDNHEPNHDEGEILHRFEYYKHEGVLPGTDSKIGANPGEVAEVLLYQDFTNPEIEAKWHFFTNAVAESKLGATVDIRVLKINPEGYPKGSIQFENLTKDGLVVDRYVIKPDGSIIFNAEDGIDKATGKPVNVGKASSLPSGTPGETGDQGEMGPTGSVALTGAASENISDSNGNDQAQTTQTQSFFAGFAGGAGAVIGGAFGSWFGGSQPTPVLPTQPASPIDQSAALTKEQAVSWIKEAQQIVKYGSIAIEEKMMTAQEASSMLGGEDSLYQGNVKSRYYIIHMTDVFFNREGGNPADEDHTKFLSHFSKEMTYLVGVFANYKDLGPGTILPIGAKPLELNYSILTDGSKPIRPIDWKKNRIAIKTYPPDITDVNGNKRLEFGETVQMIACWSSVTSVYTGGKECGKGVQDVIYNEKLGPNCVDISGGEAWGNAEMVNAGDCGSAGSGQGSGAAATSTGTVTDKPTGTDTQTQTQTDTATNTVTETMNDITTQTETATETATATNTSIETTTATDTQTDTGTTTQTETTTDTNTQTQTSTDTSSSTNTGITTETQTVTDTVTQTETATATATETNTITETTTATQTATDTATDLNWQNPNRPLAIKSIPEQSGKEGEYLSIALSKYVNNPKGSPLKYSVSGLPAGVFINDQTGEISWTPGFDAAKNYPVTVKVSDSKTTVSTSFNLVILNKNWAPYFNEDIQESSFVVGENRFLRFTVEAIDEDVLMGKDTLTYSISGEKPPGSNWDSITRTFTWTPNILQSGSYEVIFVATDNEKEEGRLGVLIEVTNFGFDPIPAQKAAEGSNFSLALSDYVNNPGGHTTMTFTASGLPEGLSVNGRGEITGVPRPGTAGAYTIDVSVFDSISIIDSSFNLEISNTDRPVETGTSTQTQTQTQTSINTATNTSIETATDTATQTGTATATATNTSTNTATNTSTSTQTTTDTNTQTQTSTDTSSLTNTATTTETQTVINTSTETATETQTSTSTNTDTATNTSTSTQTATNTNTNTMTSTSTSTNTNTDVRPVTISSIPWQTGGEGAAISIPISGYVANPDNNTLTYSASGLPNGLSINVQTGEITGTPDYIAAGQYSVSVTVTDSSDMVSSSFNLTITNTNRPPSFEPLARQSFSVREGSPLTFDVIGADPDLPNDTLTVTMREPHPDGITFDGKTFSWTPGFNQAGSYPGIGFDVTDNSGSANAVYVNIEVENYNHAPAAFDDFFTVNEDETLTGNVLQGGGLFGLAATPDMDIDQEALTVTEVNGTQINDGATVTLTHGVLQINKDGSFTYTPNPNFSGNPESESDDESFTYRISDGNGEYAAATVHINMNPVNDKPIARTTGSGETYNTDDSSTANVQENAFVFIMANSFTDTETNDPVSVLIEWTSISGGTVSSSGDGYASDSFTFIPPDSARPTDSYTLKFKVCDSEGACSDNEGQIIVTIKNRAPELKIPNEVVNVTNANHFQPIEVSKTIVNYNPGQGIDTFGPVRPNQQPVWDKDKDEVKLKEGSVMLVSFTNSSLGTVTDPYKLNQITELNAPLQNGGNYSSVDGGFNISYGNNTMYGYTAVYQYKACDGHGLGNSCVTGTYTVNFRPQSSSGQSNYASNQPLPASSSTLRISQATVSKLSPAVQAAIQAAEQRAKEALAKAAAVRKAAEEKAAAARKVLEEKKAAAKIAAEKKKADQLAAAQAKKNKK